MKKEFKVKGLVASGMVLQRNKINCICGTADVYADILMTFRGVTTITQADEEGNWRIEFSAKEAGGPFELKLQCDDKNIVYKDVYVGEVWVSSGQSNAQLPMERMRFSYSEEFNLRENPKIRMITVPIAYSFKEEQEYIENPTWIAASPETLGQMSGTGYFFAKKLVEELDIPVGIINASQGGSPITSWINKKSFEELNKTEYLKQLEFFEDDANVESKKQELQDNSNAWYAKLNEGAAAPDFSSDEGWTCVKLPDDIEIGSAGFTWFKKEIELTQTQIDHFNARKTWLWMGTIVEADTIFVNGVQVGSTAYCYPPRRYVVPGGTLKVGKNLITIRVQLNYKTQKIRFYKEKPYYLFTEDVYVEPCACRNLQKVESSLAPIDGECISLSGEWKYKTTTKVDDIPPGLFFEWQPTALYNSMLAPCFNHAIAGFLWYQGESNSGQYAEYKELLKKMIKLWRTKFKYGDKNAPFIVIQLPNWSDGRDENICAVNSEWANMREVQAEAVEETDNTAIVISIESGEWNDLHPEKKLGTSTRAALEALRINYGQRYLPYSPKLINYTKKFNKYVLEFDCSSSSLYTCVVEGKRGKWEIESSDKKIYGFSFLYEKNGEECVVEAKATLKSDYSVEVKKPLGIGNIKELRFLWADSPAPVNLYSRGWLPVGPFRVKL